jgi:hypothetical protein
MALAAVGKVPISILFLVRGEFPKHEV